MVDTDKNDEKVRATVELTGEYEQIAEIVGNSGLKYDDLMIVAEDMEAILDIVSRTGGATKSRIAAELPPEVEAELDADAVVHALRVLALYELVELDGNTWRPGPGLTSR